MIQCAFVWGGRAISQKGVTHSNISKLKIVRPLVDSKRIVYENSQVAFDQACQNQGQLAAIPRSEP